MVSFVRGVGIKIWAGEVLVLSHSQSLLSLGAAPLSITLQLSSAAVRPQPKPESIWT